MNVSAGCLSASRMTVVKSWSLTIIFTPTLLTPREQLVSHGSFQSRGCCQVARSVLHWKPPVVVHFCGHLEFVLHSSQFHYCSVIILCIFATELVSSMQTAQQFTDDQSNYKKLSGGELYTSLWPKQLPTTSNNPWQLAVEFPSNPLATEVHWLVSRLYSWNWLLKSSL